MKNGDYYINEHGRLRKKIPVVDALGIVSVVVFIATIMLVIASAKGWLD